MVESFISRFDYRDWNKIPVIYCTRQHRPTIPNHTILDLRDLEQLEMKSSRNIANRSERSQLKDRIVLE